MDHVEQFLGPAVGKGGDEHRTALIEGLVENLFKPGAQIDHRFVVPIAVSAFHDHEVHVTAEPVEMTGRIPQYGLSVAADITRKADSAGVAVVIVTDYGDGGA